MLRSMLRNTKGIKVKKFDTVETKIIDQPKTLVLNLYFAGLGL